MRGREKGRRKGEGERRQERKRETSGTGSHSVCSRSLLPLYWVSFGTILGLFWHNIRSLECYHIH